MPLEVPDCGQDADDRQKPKSLGDEVKLHFETLTVKYRKQDEKQDCERDKIADDESNLPGRILRVGKVAVIRHAPTSLRVTACRR
jgi:hypothetical protein